jgi:hypothetical protein
VYAVMVMCGIPFNRHYYGIFIVQNGKGKPISRAEIEAVA